MVTIQPIIGLVTRPSYPVKFTRDNVVAPSILRSIVIVIRSFIHSFIFVY